MPQAYQGHGCKELFLLIGASIVVILSSGVVRAQEAAPGLDVKRAPPEAHRGALLSHTLGKDGIPFPEPSESKWKPYKLTQTPMPAAPTATPLPTPTPYQQPKRCSKDESQRVVYRQDETENDLFVDYLFIPEELVPLDPQEVFGSEVSLIPYGPDADKATQIQMKIYQVPCVPYRRRMTNTTLYFDTGMNALKNYDQSVSGRGELHPIMQGKLYPNKRPSLPRRVPVPSRR